MTWIDELGRINRLEKQVDLLATLVHELLASQVELREKLEKHQADMTETFHPEFGDFWPQMQEYVKQSVVDYTLQMGKEAKG